MIFKSESFFLTSKNKATILLCFFFLFLNSINSYGQSLPQNITISVPRGDDGGLVTMVLEKYSIRDPNFCKYFVDDQTYTTNQTASAQAANTLNFTEYILDESLFPVRTYRGRILEEPNSTVIATIWPGNNSITAYIHEGQRYLWDIERLPISLNLSNGSAIISVTETQSYNYSQINSKSTDWVPTFGNSTYPTAQQGSGPVQNGQSDHGWNLIPTSNLKKMQIAFDVQPEVTVGMTNAEVIAQIEHGTNLLDLQYVRDLGIQYRVTGIVRRIDTDALDNKNDAVKIWRDRGLMDNPGSSNVTPNSIPAQQIVYSQKGEGNPVAYKSLQPLAGGNFVSIEVSDDDNGGFLHEISHTWGGAHFVYPRDIMSGGGSWFGPTTNQRHILVRNNPAITAGLQTATSVQYNYNVHPYATPDLMRTFINQSAIIEVLKNDFDSNGDDIHIADHDQNSENGGTISMNQGNLIYTPPTDFIGRDQFKYLITDGELFNETWVQVDVSNGGLELRYDFETGGQTIFDQSGAGLNGNTENFTPTLGNGLDNSNSWIFPDLGGIAQTSDNNRPFINFGDVSDPFNGSHSVSIWFKIKPAVLTGTKNCHIVSNSSTAINKLISGYNIYIDKSSKRLTFEVIEMLDENSTSVNGDLLSITGNQVQANVWIHAVMVINRDNHTIKAYMDGNQVGTSVNLNPNGIIKGKPNGDRYTSAALGICTYKPKKYTPFIGKMDEFRIYGRPLTPSEIDSLNENPTSPLDVITVTNSPADIQLFCGTSTSPSVTGQYIATSPCINSTSITYADVVAANGNITRTWSASDNCGNTTNYIQIITIEPDNSDPVPAISSLANVNAECTVNSIVTPTANDNCAGTITATTNATFPITAQGTTVVTWTYDDGNGNTATQTQNVIINDNTDPVPAVSSLANVNAECTVNSIVAPTANDNCTGTITATTNATFPITAQGTTVVTWTYNDGNGNTVTQTQNVVINDNTDPVPAVSSLTNLNAECTVNSIVSPMANDNCTGTITATTNATFPITSQGTTVVTWTYNDGNGNTAMQTQNVIINGVESNVLTSDDGVTLTVENPGTLTFQWIDCSTNMEIQGETQSTFSATSNGNFAVVIDNGNCSDTSDCIMIHQVGMNTVYKNNIKLYPNPTNSTSVIELDLPQTGTLEIITLEGRKIKKLSFNNQKEIKFGGRIVSGNYIIILTLNDFTTYKLKWIKI